jgi:hypothetical protein
MGDSTNESMTPTGVARRLAHRLLAIGENRFQLLVVEVQEERNRLVVHRRFAANGPGLLGGNARKKTRAGRGCQGRFLRSGGRLKFFANCNLHGRNSLRNATKGLSLDSTTITQIACNQWINSFPGDMACLWLGKSASGTGIMQSRNLQIKHEN